MMRNKEVLNEIRKQSRTLIEEKRDKFVKQSLLSDEFIDMMQRNRDRKSTRLNSSHAT